MRLQDFIYAYPIVLVVAIIGVWLIVSLLINYIVRTRNKRRRAVECRRSNVDRTEGLPTEEQEELLRRSAKATPALPSFTNVSADDATVTLWDFMGASNTSTGKNISRVATVTRSGKVYTGKCGSHEVVGFSIPEVLHELAEAVNREITANQ